MVGCARPAPTRFTILLALSLLLLACSGDPRAPSDVAVEATSSPPPVAGASPTPGETPEGIALNGSPEGAGDEGSEQPGLSGLVTDSDGTPLPGLFVTLEEAQGAMRTTVYTREDGAFHLPVAPGGAFRVTVHGVGVEEVTERFSADDVVRVPLQLSTAPAGDVLSKLPASNLLSVLPDGKPLRKFIIDCTGCHQPAWIYQRYRGWPTRAQWGDAVTKMLSYYGLSSGFPIIGQRDAEETADWLATELATGGEPAEPLPLSPEAADAVITEYRFPGNGPHDLLLLDDGTVLVTGMFSDDLYRLNPATGAFEQYPLPAGANPRGLDLAPDGAWWIVFGAPQQLARLEPESGDLQIFNVGMYGHSVAVDADGRAWVNGHFSPSPVRVAMVEPEDSVVTSYVIPSGSHAPEGLPISYDLQVAPDGALWTSDLHWNRINRLDPLSREVRSYTLPDADSAPRRFDIDADGVLWTPEYAGNRLARFDPSTEEFTEYARPAPNSLPYVTKVDEARGVVWIGTAARDALVAFEIAGERFTEYPLPTRFALVQHMALDEASGEVWVSHHHVPTATERVARLSPA